MGASSARCNTYAYMKLCSNDKDPTNDDLKGNHKLDFNSGLIIAGKNGAGYGENMLCAHFESRKLDLSETFSLHSL